MPESDRSMFMGDGPSHSSYTDSFQAGNPECDCMILSSNMHHRVFPKMRFFQAWTMGRKKVNGVEVGRMELMQ